MLYYIFAILMGLVCPSGSNSGQGQPTIQTTNGGGGDGGGSSNGNGGETGQVPPRPPQST
ncbi:hypothetical protein JHJ32_12245 [Parapedobacter sp. ISTM3]|uniref:hypothetical protein n=1 Tax=Parapedobacter sp. ISTM3 TaxID=2800130 RepID=UPI001904A9CC|nr:hypothetical protein [Parapedobacter sp. ISTM3]MBK1440762.1 hypothetical protein [Parapedobacter sp. ISTM3]